MFHRQQQGIYFWDISTRKRYKSYEPWRRLSTRATTFSVQSARSRRPGRGGRRGRWAECPRAAGGGARAELKKVALLFPLFLGHPRWLFWPRLALESLSHVNAFLIYNFPSTILFNQVTSYLVFHSYIHPYFFDIILFKSLCQVHCSSYWLVNM